MVQSLLRCLDMKRFTSQGHLIVVLLDAKTPMLRELLTPIQRMQDVWIGQRF